MLKEQGKLGVTPEVLGGENVDVRLLGFKVVRTYR
jgi:hypothetical protein